MEEFIIASEVGPSTLFDLGSRFSIASARAACLTKMFQLIQSFRALSSAGAGSYLSLKLYLVVLRRMTYPLGFTVIRTADCL
jgi:hypothetical protein